MTTTPLPPRQPDVRSDHGNGFVYLALLFAGLAVLLLRVVEQLLRPLKGIYTLGRPRRSVEVYIPSLDVAIRDAPTEFSRRNFGYNPDSTRRSRQRVTTVPAKTTGLTA